VRGRSDPALLRHLGRRSVACPACGYDLKGVREASCPECGEPVTRASLAHPDLRPGAWWRDVFLVGAAFTTLATIFGVCAVMVGASVTASWKGPVVGALGLGAALIQMRLLYLGIWRARAFWRRKAAIVWSILLVFALIGVIVVVWLV